MGKLEYNIVSIAHLPEGIKYVRATKVAAVVLDPQMISRTPI